MTYWVKHSVLHEGIYINIYIYIYFLLHCTSYNVFQVINVMALLLFLYCNSSKHHKVLIFYYRALKLSLELPQLERN